MTDDKRLMLAIALSVLVLFGWNFFFSPPPRTKPVKETATEKSLDKKTPAEVTNVSDFKPDETINTDAASSIPNQAVQGETVQKVFRKIEVTTPFYDVILSENGAAIKSLSLKNYKDNSGKDSPLREMVSQNLTKGTFITRLEKQSIPEFNNAVFTADIEQDSTQVNEGEKSIEFIWAGSDGMIVKKIYTFSASSYLIKCDVIFQNSSSKPFQDSLSIMIQEFADEEKIKKARFAFQGPNAFIDNELIEVKLKKIKEKDTFHGKIDWAGYSDRYFLKAVAPKDRNDLTIKLSHEDDIITNKLIQPMEKLDPGQQVKYSYDYYLGPKSLKILSDYDNNLKEAVYFGWFTILAKPLLVVMNYIYNVVPNYGVAIILLTIIIKLLFWPLGTKSYKSMNEMKKVQPLMKEIREKYKDDKQKMNQETMALYKTYKVNPAGGCLPMLVQMPIFFALYRMLYQAIELRHAPFVGWITDLSAPDRLFHFNFSIPMMQDPQGIPVLTLLMGASFLLQQKMSPSTGDPAQAKMMMLMPIFMTVIFINFSSGLVLYMLVNNIISVGQQYYIQKKFS